MNDFDSQPLHVVFAEEAFKNAFTALLAPSLSLEESELALHSACASLWHRQQQDDATDKQFSSAYWLLARIYLLQEDTARAISYIELALEVAKEDALSCGYAHEAYARAAVLLGKPALVKEHLMLAKSFAKKISDEESQTFLLEDIAQVKY